MKLFIVRRAPLGARYLVVAAPDSHGAKVVAMAWASEGFTMDGIEVEQIGTTDIKRPTVLLMRDNLRGTEQREYNED